MEKNKQKKTALVLCNVWFKKTDTQGSSVTTVLSVSFFGLDFSNISASKYKVSKKYSIALLDLSLDPAFN